VEGPWATGERLLVCVGPDALSERVVRVASRLASGLNARWTVLSLMRPGLRPEDREAASRLEETLALAERFGAEVRRVAADDFVLEIFRIARRENITQIVVGRPRTGLLSKLVRRSLPEAILKGAGEIGVHIVPGPAEDGPVRFKAPKKSRRQWLIAFGVPVLAVGATTMVGFGLSALVALQNLSMLYLAAVVTAAMLAGRSSALLAAALSVIAYNFFFIEPTETLSVAQPHEVFTLLIFVGVALAVGTLAGRLRDALARSREQARATEALFAFSRKLSGAFGVDDVIDAITSHLHETLQVPVLVLTPEDKALQLRSAWPPDQGLGETEMVAARWSVDKREPAGFMTGTLPQIPYLFHPIRAAQRVVGSVGLLLGARAAPLSPEEEQTLAALLAQAAVALDRARLVRENALAQAAREGEKLQSAILSSLSHDLRTPLAGITGAVTSLRQLGERMDAGTRDDLLLSIEEESGRMSRFLGNLFDMTRIESRSLKPKREPLAVAEVVERAVARAKTLHPNLAIETSIAAELGPVLADPVLLEHVLFNLFDNAKKYGGEQPVSLFARSEGRQAVISVTDGGKGIPAQDLEKIFEKFFRRAKGDGRPAGTGLGLSIARGFIEAMGGTIRAESPAIKKRGTRFVIRLPLGEGAA
jgi:two-component system, OmpR family, sensor histidine kinase KdpD